MFVTRYVYNKINFLCNKIYLQNIRFGTFVL